MQKSKAQLIREHKLETSLLLKKNQELEKKVNKYNLLCVDIFNWLAEFGKNENTNPNAAYGLKMFSRLIRETQ